MKKFLLLTMLAASLMFTGCDDDDDGYSLNDQWIALTTVVRPTPSSVFFLRLDGGEVLWAAAPIGFPEYPYPTGQRLLTNYTYLGQAPADAPYNYNVLVNGVRELLTKGVTTITTDAQLDSVGNTPYVNIPAVDIGYDYLNVDFRIRVNHYRHMLSLVVDKRPAAPPFLQNDTVYMSLHQNAFGDTGGRVIRDVACFNLSSLQQYANSGAGKINVHVTVPLEDGTNFIYKGTYNWATPSKSTMDVSGFLNVNDPIEVQ